MTGNFAIGQRILSLERRTILYPGKNISFLSNTGSLSYHCFSRRIAYIIRKKEKCGTLLRLVLHSVESVTDDVAFPYRLLLRPLSSVI
jgi:hypothetical protein